MGWGKRNPLKYLTVYNFHCKILVSNTKYFFGLDYVLIFKWSYQPIECSICSLQFILKSSFFSFNLTWVSLFLHVSTHSGNKTLLCKGSTQLYLSEIQDFKKTTVLKLHPVQSTKCKQRCAHDARHGVAHLYHFCVGGVVVINTGMFLCFRVHL